MFLVIFSDLFPTVIDPLHLDRQADLYHPLGQPFHAVVGRIFEEDEAKVCQKGMHFCKRPLDVLHYYPLVDKDGNMTEFSEVEALDKPVTDDNEKYCSK